MKLPAKDGKSAKRNWHDDGHMTSKGAAKALGVAPSKMEALRRDASLPQPTKIKKGAQTVYTYSPEVVEALAQKVGAKTA